MKKLSKYISKPLLLVFCFIQVVILIIGFFYCDSFSRNLIKNSTGSFFIGTVNEGMSNDETSDVIQSSVEKYHINAFLDTSDSDTDIFKVYSFIGNEQLYNTEVQNGDFIPFSRNSKISIIPRTEIHKHSLLGNYQIVGDTSVLPQIVKDLQKVGISVDYSANKKGSIFSMIMFIFVLLQYKLWLLFISIMLGLVYAILYFVRKHLRSVAVLRINGYTKKRSLSKILFIVFFTYLLAFIPTNIIAIIFLFLYNHLSAFSEFFAMCITTSFVVIIFSIVFTCICYYGMLTKANYHELINGNTKQNAVNKISLSLQFILFFVTFVFLGISVINIQTLAHEIKSYSGFEKIKDYSYFTLGLEIRSSQADHDIGEFLKIMTDENRIILADRGKFNIQTGLDSSGAFDEPSNTLMVNQRFLEFSDILDANGNSIQGRKMDKKYQLVIPVSQKNNTSKYTENAVKYINSMEPYKNYIRSTTDDIEVIYSMDNQNINNFNSGKDMNQGAKYDSASSTYNPIVVIVKDDSPILYDSSAVSALSYAGVILNLEGVDMEKIGEQVNIEKYITATSNVSASALATMHEKQIVLALVILGLMLSFLTILFISVVSVTLYVEQNKRAIFLKITNGYSFSDIHYLYMLRFLIVPFLSFLLAVITRLLTFTVLNIAFFLIILLLNVFFGYLILKHAQQKAQRSLITFQHA
ncbi:MAG: DUF1430 domain-containing protein [Candidatus Ancillula sp.]|jgi:hypothetical protein|nr:DUF1430 domain-containing protein [Candidatus Ancillula sp.]